MPKEPIHRIYSFSDSALIQWMRKMAAILQLYLTDFGTYDPMFDMAFAIALETEVDDAEAIPDDPTVLGQQKAYTEQVAANMILSRDVFLHIKRFVKKAFPNSPAKWDEFGFSRYKHVRNTQDKMILFLRDLHVTAEKYKTELIAVNYTQAMIDNILATHGLLTGSDSDQEVKKDTRTVDTETRIIAYNTLYEKGADICDAGQYLYRNDPAKYNIFIIPVEKGHKEIYTGTVGGGLTVTVIEKDFTGDFLIELTNIGTTELMFCLSAAEGEACTAGITVASGTSQTVNASELGDVSFTFLNVTNLDPATEGSYSVAM
ncbi:MAG: hypothetical protein ISS16_12315 [Ignavibacteria bacterium]|nr:hypothetical protein [Ignavibacteria bacterium]